MKTALRALVIILIEIFAVAALLFACVQFFPGKDEVTITEEDLTAGEGSNAISNIENALEENIEEETPEEALEDEAEADTDNEAEVPAE